MIEQQHWWFKMRWFSHYWTKNEKPKHSDKNLIEEQAKANVERFTAAINWNDEPKFIYVYTNASEDER